MKRFSQAALSIAGIGMALMASPACAAPFGEPSSIVRFGPLNHPIRETWVGTSLNIVSGALDDEGPISGDWDFNFLLLSQQLKLWKIQSPNRGQYAVGPDNMARLYQPGEPIGPNTTFSSEVSGSVTMSEAWRSGANGYLGVRFQCNGRLPDPVPAPGVCYGFVHLQTSGPSGFPATILDTAFDTGGNAIVVSPFPSAAVHVSPAALSLSAPPDASASASLVVANPGESTLTFAISIAAAQCSQPGALAWLGASPQSGSVAVGNEAQVTVSVNTAGLAPGRYSANVCIGTNDPAQPLIAVPVSLAVAGGNGIIESGPLNHAIVALPTGTSLNLVSGELEDTGPIDANWDFNFFSYHGQLKLWKVDGGSTGHYALDASGKARMFRPGEQIGPGTLFSSGYGSVAVSDAWLAGAHGYLGVRINCDGRLAHPIAAPGVCYGYLRLATTAPNGFPATILDGAFDGDGHSIVVDPGADDLPPMGMVVPGALTFALEAGASDTQPLMIANVGGNYLVYWIGIGIGGCGNPGDAPWLGVTPASGSVAGGMHVGVAVTADAATLAEGGYSANLCVATNDPNGQVIPVPVSLTVAPGALLERVFCSGFESGEDSACGFGNGTAVP